MATLLLLFNRWKGGGAGGMGGGAPSPAGDSLLTEDSFYLLQENGDKILLE